MYIGEDKVVVVRRSDFFDSLYSEFGRTKAELYLRDIVLPDIGNVSAEKALEEGQSPKSVWLALCRYLDVPPSRWY